jgi:hypothetical protein
MCDNAHRYTIEVIGQVPRYAGTDRTEALAALLGVSAGDGDAGYAVAEHDLGDSTSYCPVESKSLERSAALVLDTARFYSRENFDDRSPDYLAALKAMTPQEYKLYMSLIAQLSFT